MVLLDQIKDLEKRLLALYHHLKIEAKIGFVESEELKTQQDDFWHDSKRAEAIMRAIKKTKNWIQQYHDVKQALEDLVILNEFFLEKEVSSDEIEDNFNKTKCLLENLEFKNMLSNNEDHMPAILTINPGAALDGL